MFNFKLYNFDSIILDISVKSVYFNEKNKGRSGILNNHENYSFKVDPGSLKIETENGEKIFFIGPGFGKIENNHMDLYALPIFYDLQEFKNYCAELGEYGEYCLRNFI